MKNEKAEQEELEEAQQVQRQKHLRSALYRKRSEAGTRNRLSASYSDD
jgi:hypothetical protein